MTTLFKYLSSIFLLLFIISSCEKKEYSMGDLTPPSELVLNVELVGKDATHPNGDGSGDVKITMSAKNALSYKVDYDANNDLDLIYLPTGTITRKYTLEGLHTYVVTAVAYGKAGTSTTVSKEITVQSNFSPDPAIVAALTGTGTKSWVVDKSIPGHFGVGPIDGSVVPMWWSAGVNEKVTCCNCFYTSEFKFTKTGNAYSLTVTSPDGAFTKTGALAGGLPGIPGTGDEACYSGYSGGASAFSFVPASSNIPVSTPSTATSIQLAGSNTFIGYGAVLKEYEILSITETTMYLRVQGTETGNAWYIKLKAL